MTALTLSIGESQKMARLTILADTLRQKLVEIPETISPARRFKDDMSVSLETIKCESANKGWSQRAKWTTALPSIRESALASHHYAGRLYIG